MYPSTTSVDTASIHILYSLKRYTARMLEHIALLWASLSLKRMARWLIAQSLSSRRFGLQMCSGRRPT
ncbi:hypothetical protein Naga_100688g1 [Nannochloropsis gaditana]|uniref:Uncharacterized protein n=1 Tax=Nannochloropsis gaditana TaxID=72520 RepID=W7T9N0_9STRA|nr:hypothetical protein Naga_100688g1 [Nannochloropsis gaditana]